MFFPKRICQVSRCHYWRLSDSWQHLWCGCLFHRCVKNCVMLQRSPQHPSTNNSAGAQEPLKPGEQATSLPFFSPSPQPTHSGTFVCLWDTTSHIEKCIKLIHFNVLGSLDSSNGKHKLTPLQRLWYRVGGSKKICKWCFSIQAGHMNVIMVSEENWILSAAA